MKVIVVEQVGAGGMVHFAYQMCSALASEGADVVLVTATDYELEALPHSFTVDPFMRLWPRFDDALMRPPPATPIGRAWRKVWWTTRRGTRAFRLLREWARVVGHVRRQNPDIVQFGQVQFPGARFLLSRLRSLTLTEVCHEFEFRESKYRWSDRLRTRLLRRTYEPFDAVFVLGEEVRERFQRVTESAPEKTHIITPGNAEMVLTPADDLSAFRIGHGLEPDDRVVLFFGNIRPSKGVPELIEAFASLGDIPKAKLMIAGYPSHKVNMHAIRRRVEELGISDRVVFDTRYIPIEDVGSLMATATVVALPYRNATQSAAIQVAFAAGRPVVATAVGSIPESVEHGATGFLVEQGSREELADALRRLLTDPELAEQLGRTALSQSSDRFAWSATARKMISVYDDLLSNVGNRRSTSTHERPN